MPKIDAEISEEYGNFVKHNAKSFVPYGKRKKTIWEYPPGVLTQYNKYIKEKEDYEHYYQLKLNKEYSNDFFVWLFGTNYRSFSEKFKKKYERNNPPPKLPNAVAESSKIEKTVKDPRNKRDNLYDMYTYRKKTYQTIAACPICNSTIQFNKVRKPPFEDKCKECDYSFTFVYRKFVERYYTTLTTTAGRIIYSNKIKTKTKKTAHYIEYEGIKPTRPRSPAKSRNISGTKRKSIPQDVRDKVWNRDSGKCVECDSKENLEFDHIIPVAKGGANTYRNLQLLCEDCNRSKSDNIG